jgi:hypothetical protein
MRLSLSGGAVACLLALGLATGCGPAGQGASDAKTDTPAAAAAPATVDPAVNLQNLGHLPVAPPLKWDFSENVIVTSAPEAARSGGKAVLVTPTADMGLHRVGLVGSFGEGKRTYHVTVWVKGRPGTDLLVEARGDRMVSDRSPAEYRRTFFDLAANAVQPNSLVTDETRFAAAAVSADGEWSKVSVDMTTSDGWLYLVLGLTAKGQHGFAGTSGMGLVIGGVEVTSS